MQFLKELDIIQNRLIAFGEDVTRAVAESIRAFTGRDRKLADEVIEHDEILDTTEVAIEEEILKVLALHQPVARDLRILIAYLKINNDLERAGDLAVNIARKAKYVSKHGLPAGLDIDYSGMSERSQIMLSEAVKAIVSFDTGKAREILGKDAKVNQLKKEHRDRIIDFMKTNPAEVESLIRMHSVIRNLERVADLATNIAEDIIYISEGRIIRHLPEKDYIED